MRIRPLNSVSEDYSLVMSTPIFNVSKESNTTTCTINSITFVPPPSPNPASSPIPSSAPSTSTVDSEISASSNFIEAGPTSSSISIGVSSSGIATSSSKIEGAGSSVSSTATATVGGGGIEGSPSPSETTGGEKNNEGVSVVGERGLWKVLGGIMVVCLVGRLV